MTNQEKRMAVPTRRDVLLGAGGVLTAGAVGQRSALGQAAPERIVFIGWSQEEGGARAELTRAALADFRSANPQFRLEIVAAPSDVARSTYTLRQRNREPLDVLHALERWVPQIALQGDVVDLYEVFGRDHLVSLIEPSILRIGEVNGRLAGLPWTTGTIAMVAHGGVLQQAGISSIPDTTDEFVTALRRIKARVSGSVPFGISTRNNVLIHIETQPIFWQFGARFFSEQNEVAIDSPEARGALQFLTDLTAEGLVARGNDRFDTRRLFAEDKVGFYLDPPLARSFARQFTRSNRLDDLTLPIPTPAVRRGDPPRSVYFGETLTSVQYAGRRLTRDSGPARLMEHLVLNSDRQVEMFRRAGAFPSLRSAFAAVSSDRYVADWSKLFPTAMRDETAMWPNSAEFVDIIAEEVVGAMFGRKPVNRAITDMASRMRRARDQVR